MLQSQVYTSMEKKMKAIIDSYQEKVPDKGEALLWITIEEGILEDNQ